MSLKKTSDLAKEFDSMVAKKGIGLDTENKDRKQVIDLIVQKEDFFARQQHNKCNHTSYTRCNRVDDESDLVSGNEQDQAVTKKM